VRLRCSCGSRTNRRRRMTDEGVVRVHHDPEQLAARFIDGRLGRTERWRFERHLVECRECWGQVQQARAGRSAAESLRVVAPSRVRERVRATPELDSTATAAATQRRSRSGPALVAVAVVLAAVVVGVVTRDADRATGTLPDVVAAYRDPGTWRAATASPPALVLAGLRWTATRATAIDDERVLGFTYDGRPGDSVLVVRQAGSLEPPVDADPVAGADWRAELDGVTVICTQPPDQYLVIGTDPALVTQAARTLGGLTR